MEGYQIALFLLAWIISIWIMSRFGRFRNRKAGDGRGKYKRWW